MKKEERIAEGKLLLSVLRKKHITEEQYMLSALWNTAFWYGFQKSQDSVLDFANRDGNRRRWGATKFRHIKEIAGHTIPTPRKTLSHNRRSLAVIREANRAEPPSQDPMQNSPERSRLCPLCLEGEAFICSVRHEHKGNSDDKEIENTKKILYHCVDCGPVWECNRVWQEPMKQEGC